MNSLYSFTTLFLFFLNFHICFGDDPNLYTTCKNYFSCGTQITNVGFPFWDGDIRPKECGYSELKLTCDQNQTPKIDIKDTKFNVLDIDPKTQVLTIVREDFMNDICLLQSDNIVLDFNVFDYAPGYKNITVFYGCPATSYTTHPAQFTCISNSGGDSYGGGSTTVSYIGQGALDLGSSGCSGSIVVPVLGSLVSKINQKSSLEQAIQKGFGVEYSKVANQKFCGDCVQSKGVCGFEDSKISCFCADGSGGNLSCGTKNASLSTNSVSTPDKKILSTRKMAIIAFYSSLGICLIVLAFYFKRKYSSVDQEQDVEAFLRSYETPGLKRYTYRNLKKITNSFKDKLGEGGYGIVYRGFLHSDQLVAVKILKKSGDTGEFINEVASIGMTNHVNVVTLLGFCYEGDKRALVYEFMPNGSLEKFVYTKNNNQSLDWQILFEIAAGVARGLEYLHRGCNTRILHFDIKPHNILLDENFCPKISDFGLAKSCPKKDSIISISEARGTVGYIAPVVFLRSFGGVSYKSDVYSYGMLVLEMVGCRKGAGIRSEASDVPSFPRWIYEQLENGEEVDKNENLSWEEKEIQRKMILVSLWCIQTNPSSRPAMSKVVEMLEGNLDCLQIPLATSLFSSLRSQLNFSILTTTSSSEK